MRTIADAFGQVYFSSSFVLLFFSYFVLPRPACVGDPRIGHLPRSKLLRNAMYTRLDGRGFGDRTDRF